MAIHRGGVAQGNKEIRFILIRGPILINVQNAAEPIFAFFQHVCRDVTGADVFVDRKDLQLGGGL